MKSSRTKNSVRNSLVGSASQVISITLNFIVRTIFIYYLGKEYLGVNGLFTNILYVLNFAELGIGNAIVFNMYKPVADGDRERIKSLVNLYKRIYLVIGFVILILGLLVIPFMPYIILDAPNIKENLIIIYLLFLSETVGTYFFGYKRSVLLVYEKNYINNLVDLSFSCVKSIVQIFVLIFTRNFILYLVVYLLSTILSNVYISLTVNKKYPFLKEKNVTKLGKNELKKLWSDIRYIFIYKIGNTILNGTDNIIISAFVGIIAVGLYSNYSVIIASVSGVLWTILSGFTGSLGNLNTTDDKEKQEKIFSEVLFLSCFLYGFGCVCLGVLFKPFIILWIGEEYLLNISTVLCLIIVLYLRGSAFASDVYRDTLGLFKEGRAAPLISSIINIVLSIVLGIKFGITGVFLATVTSILIISFWYMPNIIYKKIFKGSIKTYLKKFTRFTLPYVISYIACYFIIDSIEVYSFLSLLLKMVIVTLITLFMVFVFERNTPEYRAIKNKMICLIKEKNI